MSGASQMNVTICHLRRVVLCYAIVIFVTVTVSVEKKSVMWRNFKFLYMRDVGDEFLHVLINFTSLFVTGFLRCLVRGGWTGLWVVEV